MQQAIDDEPRVDRRDFAAKTALVLIATVVMGTMTVMHVDGINGSPYYTWAWRWIAPWRWYPAMLAALTPALLAQALWPGARRAALAMLVLGTFLLQCTAAGMHKNPFDLAHIAHVVQHRIATSYFTDAELLAAQPDLRPWIRDYHELMFHFNLHCKQKPPGGILFYYAIIKAIQPPGMAALITGLLIGAISACSVAATYLLARFITGNRDAAFASASFLSLSPSLVLFFPTFDICYPLLTCGIIGFWIKGLQTGRPGWYAAFGLILCLAVFFTYNVLTLGTLVIGIAVLHWINQRRTTLRRVAAASSVTVLLLAAVYGTAYLLSGFNAVATFLKAWENQRYLAQQKIGDRPYLPTMPGDIQDFIMAMGWIGFLLIVFWVLRLRREHRANAAILLLATLQPLVVLATGLLRCETTRVWAFMLPLVMLPIGLELSRWNRLCRIITYAALGFLTAAIGQNMKFLL